ncbi:MAG: lysophospholipid acyltransferase family protein [Bryobacteraceae bacterium]
MPLTIGRTALRADRKLPGSVANSQPPVAPRLVTLNDLLWLLYLYPVRWAAGIMPRSFLYAIGRLADPIVQCYSRGRKAKAIPWIAEACRVSPGRAGSIVRRSLSNSLFGLLDHLLLLRPSSKNALRCEEVDGIQHLESAIARGKGVILLVGHFPANRVAGRYLAGQGYAVLSLRNRSATNVAEGWLGRRFLQPRWMELQKITFPDHVYVQDPECSLTILKRMRAGGLAVLQLDGLAGTNPVEHLFLGRPRSIPTGIFQIVRLSDCAVVPMLCLGRSDGFRIRFDPMLDVVPASSRDAFLSSNLSQFVTAIERQVVENPEEWKLWIHFLARPV